MRRKSSLFLLFGCSIAVLAASVQSPAHALVAQPRRGAEVFANVCSGCHAGGEPRAPAVHMLRLMSSRSIYRVLTAGAMQLQARGLSDADKRAVAEYLGMANTAASSGTGAPLCESRQSEFDYRQTPAFQGWGMSLDNTRAIPSAVSGLNPENIGGLRLKWAMSFPDAQRARSEPAVAGGALYVGSQNGTVYSLDLASGCARWTFPAAAEVRTGLVISPWHAGNTRAEVLLYFGDLIGNVYALNAVTGQLVWKDHPEAHPGATITATPALYNGRLYVGVSSLEEAMNDPRYACCTFRGLLVAYDARTGRRIWRTYTIPPPAPQATDSTGGERLGPSGAGVWGSPAIDPKRRQIYIVTGDNYSDPPTNTSDAVIALDLASGKVKWIYQATAGDAWNNGCRTSGQALCPLQHGADTDFGAAPIIAALGRGQALLLAGQKSGWVYAIDPNTGRAVWKRRVGRGGIDGGVEFGMALLGHRLFVPINDMMDVALGLHVLGIARPGMHALDIRNGAPLWQTRNDGRLCRGRPSCMGGLQGTPMATHGLVMIGSLDGWFRIYSAATGKVLWRYDTTQPVRTVGGGTAQGGSMGGGAGPIAYHHLLIVPSGYGFARKMPGNALLVFATDRRARASAGCSKCGPSSQ